MALAYTKGMPLGTEAPAFELPGVDGEMHALSRYAEATAVVVVFTCNHCPYAVAVEERLIALQREYGPRGVQLIAISANDHPSDTFPKMQQRAKERGFNFPYLYDESQEVARAYGAACTPDIYAFGPNRALAYNGRFDDSWQDAAAVQRRELALALDRILDGKPVDFEVTASMGCSIKWRD